MSLINSASEWANPAARPGTEKIIASKSGNVFGNISIIPKIMMNEITTAISVFFNFIKTYETDIEMSSLKFLSLFSSSVRAGKKWSAIAHTDIIASKEIEASGIYTGFDDAIVR